MVKYTVAQFLKAIPGTAGIVSSIARNVGCAWDTANRHIEDSPTLRTAVDNERHVITDKAKHNIIKAINVGDLSMSKWWLQVMDEDFVPREKQELGGIGGGPIQIEDVNETRQRLLESIQKSVARDDAQPEDGVG
jgi:hypothetical protein